MLCMESSGGDDFAPSVLLSRFGTPSWSGKSVHSLSASDVLNILIFCDEKGLEKGWTDCKYKAINLQPFFSKGFLCGIPRLLWASAYQDGINSRYEHRGYSNRPFPSQRLAQAIADLAGHYPTIRIEFASTVKERQEAVEASSQLIVY